MTEEAQVVKEDAGVEVVVAIFEAEDSAHEAMLDLKNRGKDLGLKVVSAAVLTKDSDGKVTVEESHHLPRVHRLLNKRHDPNKALLSHVEDALSPCTSAFVALVEEHMADPLVTELAQFNAEVVRQGLSEEIAAQVTADAAAIAAKAALPDAQAVAAATAVATARAGDVSHGEASVPVKDARLTRSLINNVGGVIDQDAPSADQVLGDAPDHTWSDTPVDEEEGRYRRHNARDDYLMPSYAELYTDPLREA